MRAFRRILSALLCPVLVLSLLTGLALLAGAVRPELPGAGTNGDNELPIIPITPHTHTWDAGTVTTEPTCTRPGEMTYHCTTCTSGVKTEPIDPLGHDYKAVVTEPTCTEAGFTTFTCSRCGDTYVGDETEALGHDYVGVVTEPTCTAGGFTTFTCSRCGDSYIADETAPLGHTPGEATEENRLDPSCTAPGGYDTVTCCATCGAELSRVHTDLPALGHDWDEGVTETSPTCTGGGLTRYTCRRCGETRTEASSASGHTPGEATEENRVEPSCTVPGGYDTVVRCTVCGAILSSEHTELPASGHDYVGVVTAPTCTETGFTRYTCSACSDSYVGEATAPLGHDWGEPEYVWADDCGTVTATRICKNDESHIETETVHTTFEVTKEATYEEEGEITYTARFENAAFATQTKAVATPKLVRPVEFTDVPGNAYYADAVAWAVANGVTNGTSATTFSPDKPCTRAQVVTFLWRAAGCPAVDRASSPFTDVDPGAYYYDAVRWAVAQGITNGTGATTFSPDKPCTRAQVVTFLWRAEGKPEATEPGENETLVMGENPFTDVDGNAYYYKAVLWAVAKGVTTGTGAATFSPDKTCTRGQIVTFLYRDLGQQFSAVGASIARP